MIFYDEPWQSHIILSFPKCQMNNVWLSTPIIHLEHFPLRISLFSKGTKAWIKLMDVPKSVLTEYSLCLSFSETWNGIIGIIFQQSPVSHKCSHISSHLLEADRSYERRNAFSLNSALSVSWSHGNANTCQCKLSSLQHCLKLLTHIFRRSKKTVYITNWFVLTHPCKMKPH